MRLTTLVLLALPALAATQASAQTARPASSTKPAMPAGWHMKLDAATLPNDYAFAATGGAIHATTGRAAGVAFDPAMTATGRYRLEATFTQNKAPSHPEAYGLVFGGAGLDTEKAEYFYFIVRGDGKYAVKHHASNGDVHTVADWTPNAALKAADAQGKATNALRVEVAADSVRLFANGAPVSALPRGVRTDGTVGLRINHALDVRVEGLKVTPAK